LASIRVDRHPFPSLDLSVRIPDKVQLEYGAILRKTDAIFIDKLRNSR
jgi:GMP synthase PP-ATPase subunit